MGSLIGLSRGEDYPGKFEGVSRLRSDVRSAASRVLWWGVVTSVLRGALAPWYVKYFGDAMSRTQPTNTQMISSRVMTMAIFLFATVAAKVKPVFACFVAFIGFAAVCWIDFHQTPDVFEAGVLSKAVMLALLVWATMNAIFSRVL